MTNEVLRIYDKNDVVIYERVSREHKGISKYFSKDGLEFTDIRGVKAFIKSLEDKN